MKFTVTLNISTAILWMAVYWRMKQEYLEKSTNLSQFTAKLYNVVSSTPRNERDQNNVSRDKH